MPRHITLALLSIGVLCAVLLIQPAASQSDGIFVAYNETREDFGMGGSADLNTELEAVGPRFVFIALSSRHDYSIVRNLDLEATMAEVGPRFKFTAVTMRDDTVLEFPRALINDTTPPEVVGTVTVETDSDTATLTFETDEFTRGTVRYGYQSGNYTQETEFELYERQQTVVLEFDQAARAPETIEQVCYTIELEDLSGNTTTIPESCVAFLDTVYLPFVQR
jgi:hypothetical protein